jgi:hypothetical protein
MNVAEYERNSRSIETYSSRSAGLVESKIEPFALKHREDIMKPRVEVWELDRSSHRHSEDMRTKSFVLLYHSVMPRGRWRRVNVVAHGCKPDDDI